MNILKLMNMPESELMAIAGEQFLKDGCDSFVLFKDKEGKFQYKALKFNIMDHAVLLASKVKEMQEIINELKSHAGNAE